MYRWSLIDVCEMCLRHEQLQRITQVHCGTAFVGKITTLFTCFDFFSFNLQNENWFRVPIIIVENRSIIIKNQDQAQHINTVYSIFSNWERLDARPLGSFHLFAEAKACLSFGRHSAHAFGLVKREHIPATIETQCQLNPWHAISYFCCAVFAASFDVPMSGIGKVQCRAVRVAGRD